MLDTTCCPECGALAEIQWRSVMDGTDGPVEHAKILCVARHWFLLPVEALVVPKASDVLAVHQMAAQRRSAS
jgi:hypothetical protein